MFRFLIQITSPVTDNAMITKPIRQMMIFIGRPKTLVKCKFVIHHVIVSDRRVSCADMDHG